ncbi:U-box domain-containing protein 19-like [Aristolochia californica]|uniref:U-box domain-containing protein 19-like n=1 Tax=Aristolochia californica TaxID=171875 RepID=UPI0035D93A03
MFQRSDRRLLTSAVVRPCEDVSLDTLLSAVIALCQAISAYQSPVFGAHRRTARETVREIGILLVFLEEIRDGRPALPGSVTLCFSELYVILQKVRCLLEDCASDGARLWILMNSDRVISEFRVLIRSIATALDVLPLASIDVTTEVRELVALLKSQTWKVRIEIDPVDESVRNSVLTILGRFEDGVVPDSCVIKRVLDSLDIRSWSDCNKEIRFLEEEIELENSKAEKKEIGFLGSLLGFANYCRSVIFDVVDGRISERLDGKCEGEVINYLNPADFRCPISLEMMTDPVTVATGQTYDRVSIEKWLRAGNFICPKTGEKLMNTELVPNSALRKLIHQFCYEHGISVAGSGNRSREIAKTLSTTISPPAVGATRMLAVFLAEKLSTGTEQEQNKAAYEIRLLAKFSVFNRACLVEAGSILWLLILLSSSYPSTQENSIAGLLNLSQHPKGKTVIVETGGLDPIVEVLRNGLRPESRQNAAAVLFYISSVDEYREIIGELPEAIPSLVALLKHGSPRGKKNAIVALFGLLLFPGNHPRVLAAGAVPGLMNLLTLDRTDLVDDVLAVLAALAERPEGTIEILKTSVIPLLMGVMHSSSSRTGKEHCISVFLSLCINGGSEVISILRKTPSLMVSLYSSLTDGTARAGKKANSLLSILHEWPSSRSMLASTVPQDTVVHAR